MAFLAAVFGMIWNWFLIQTGDCNYNLGTSLDAAKDAEMLPPADKQPATCICLCRHCCRSCIGCRKQMQPDKINETIIFVFLTLVKRKQKKQKHFCEMMLVAEGNSGQC